MHVVSKEHVFWLSLIAEGKLNWENSILNTSGRGTSPRKNLVNVMLFGIPDHVGEEALKKAILQARVKVFFHRSGYSREKVTKLLEGEFQGLSNPPSKPTEAEIAVASEHVDKVIRLIESKDA